jgi:hypothetical protein
MELARLFARHVDRLIGWGEGLTPAGDDFLVGLCAALAALAGDDAMRLRFQARLSARLADCEGRTTPIAAHCLRLAAQGHYAERLLCLRNALLAAESADTVGTAVDRALDCGATSGADTVSGLLAGLAAWLPAAACAA